MTAPPCAFAIVAPDAPARFTKKLSELSTRPSSFTDTEIVRVVVEPEKESVPEVAV
jgi:hypothetical protein